MSDYTSVDANVTRYGLAELSRPFDWQTLILHYLGVDHIGHSFGGRSLLIRQKLTEVDTVIEEVYTAMEKTVRRVYTAQFCGIAA